MTETVALALIAAIPPTLASIGAIIIGLRNGKRAERSSRKSEAISASIAEKADVIAGHVNSAASASASKIEGLQSQVTQMHETIATQTQAAALLAQAVTQKDHQ